MVEEREELRRWSAEKVMGWEWVVSSPQGGPDYWETESYIGEAATDWRPDDPATGQIWLIVDKMRELGWMIGFNNFGDTDITGLLLGSNEFEVEFLHNEVGSFTATNTNPCLAILGAAKMALEEGKNEHSNID